MSSSPCHKPVALRAAVERANLTAPLNSPASTRTVTSKLLTSPSLTVYWATSNPISATKGNDHKQWNICWNRQILFVMAEFQVSVALVVAKPHKQEVIKDLGYTVCVQQSWQEKERTAKTMTTSMYSMTGSKKIRPGRRGSTLLPSYQINTGYTSGLNV